MAKGGFTGAVPPRETSPEDYSGVWDIVEQYGEQKAGSWPFQPADCAPKSLRFDGSSSYLSKTPTQAGNKRTWTFSFWVKRCNVGSATQVIWMAYNAAIDEANYATISFTSTGQLRVGYAYDTYKTTTAQYRDPSAWMHCCVSVDTNRAVASERVQIYINSVKQTDFAGTHDPDLGQELAWNGSYLHHLGSEYNQQYSHNLLSEVHFIDGQALSCEEFGFFDGQGIWQPKRFTGDYSSGPVYSNFLTSSGSFATSSEGPDKAFDGIATAASRAKGSTDNILTFDISSFGFTGLFELWSQNTGAEFSIDGGSNWSAIGDDVWTTVSSDISGVSTIQMRPASGATMKVSAFKSQGQLLTDASVGRNSFRLDFSDGVKDQSGLGNDWTATNITLPSSIGVTNTVPQDVTGDWIGILGVTATNTNGPVAVFPDGGGIANAKGTFYWSGLTSGDTITWYGTASGESSRQVTGDISESTVAVPGASLGSISLTVTAASGSAKIDFNGSANCYGITPGLTSGEIFVDSPVNGNEASTGAGGERRANYATLNPLASDSPLLNGNLESDGASGAWKFGIGTIPFPKSGKWYFEVQATAYSGNFGIAKLLSSSQINATIRDSSESTAVWYAFDGKVWSRYSGQGSTTSVQTGLTTFNNGDIVGFGVNVDDEEVKFYVNGSLQYTYSLPTQIAADLTAGRLFPVVDTYNGVNAICNFGQRPFSHPLSGFSPLATSFLPEPTIKRGDEAMDVVTYTGNGSNPRAITGVGHSSDFVWIKARNAAAGHALMDSVRGPGNNTLASHTTGAEGSETYGQMSSFDSDGFTVTSGSTGAQNVNENNRTFVAWSWDAGDATTTIAAGGLNSSVYASGRTWSNDLSATSLANANKMFDWTYGYGSYTGTCTWTTTDAAYSSLSGRVYLANNTTLTLGITFKDSGGNVLGTFSLPWTGNGQEMQDTGFDWSSNVASVEITGDYLPVRVHIGNQILVDTGTSVDNVPSIATTVRANPSAGFSIATYTSPNSSSDQSFGHGLNAKPDFALIKNRDTSYNWDIYHSSLGYNSSLIFTDAGTRSGAFSAEPTSSVINTKTNYTHNGTDDYLALCWTAVEGYSAFGSYTGTGTSDNSTPFIYTGFKPRWIAIKRSDSTASWQIYDTARGAYNVVTQTLAANEAAAESSFVSGYDIDLLSNGFKVRTGPSNAINASGGTYVYVAFASQPFASNARAR